MSLLFPYRKYSDDSFQDFNFIRKDKTGDTRALIIRGPEKIKPHGTLVYRAKLGVMPNSHADTDLKHEEDVVCKLILKDMTAISMLYNEVEAYAQLSTLQGMYIPRFIGLFEGSIRGMRACCLVLGDCGFPLRVSFGRTPWTFR